MTTLEKIGQKIVEFRYSQGMTQEDLAGLAEIDRSYLSELEHGLKNPSILILEKIAKALKVDISDLVPK